MLDGTPPPWATRRALAMTTVTQLVYFFRCPLVYWFDLVLQIDEHPRARGKAGARSGTAARRMTALERGSTVHALLERADLGAEPNAEARRLADAAESVAEVETVDPAERERIATMLAAVLSDPLLDRARGAARLEREYPFYLDVGGTTVQGVIDLVFADAAGRGVVVDFKSNDLAAPGRLRTLSDLYRPQIEMYALAAKRAGLAEPEEATLYFLNRAQAVTTRMDAARIDAIEREAASAVEKIARGAWDTEPGEKCRPCGYRTRGLCEVGKRFRE
jgi:ATP-dependent helicase/nuclease subunit A